MDAEPFVREDMPSSGEQDHTHVFSVDLDKKGPKGTVLSVCERCGECRWVPSPKPIEESRKPPVLLG